MQELYREYSQLNKAIQQLSANEKQDIVSLTMKSEWKSFNTMLDNWKNRIMIICIKAGKSSEDLITAQAQLRNIAVLKTFQNQYKNIKVNDTIKDEDKDSIQL